MGTIILTMYLIGPITDITFISTNGQVLLMRLKGAAVIRLDKLSTQ